MPQLIWTATAEGTPDYYNERWYEFTGFPRDSFGDQSWKEIIHPDDQPRTVDASRASIRTGDIYQIDTPNGPYIGQSNNIDRRMTEHARDPRFTQEQLDEFYDIYDREEIRGATPRYFEDVNVGDKLPPMMKGPMTVTGFIAYAQGWGGLYIRANKMAWKMQQAHPGLGIKNRFNVPDCPERVHWDEAFALEVGAPGAYDYGPERTSWLTHHMTNWIGDDGFLHKSNCQIRRHNPDGDAIIITGEVKRKFEENGKKYVEVSQKATTHRGELSAFGTAVAELPSKA